MNVNDEGSRVAVDQMNERTKGPVRSAAPHETPQAPGNVSSTRPGEIRNQSKSFDLSAGRRSVE